MAADHELVLWSDEKARADRVANVAIADVLRIEAKFSRYRDDSVTSAINRAAGGASVAIDGETAALLRYADRCHQLSGGRFDRRPACCAARGISGGGLRSCRRKTRSRPRAS